MSVYLLIPDFHGLLFHDLAYANRYFWLTKNNFNTLIFFLIDCCFSKAFLNHNNYKYSFIINDSFWMLLYPGFYKFNIGFGYPIIFGQISPLMECVFGLFNNFVNF